MLSQRSDPPKITLMVRDKGNEIFHLSSLISSSLFHSESLSIFLLSKNATIHSICSYLLVYPPIPFGPAYTVSHSFHHGYHFLNRKAQRVRYELFRACLSWSMRRIESLGVSWIPPSIKGQGVIPEIGFSLSCG